VLPRALPHDPPHDSLGGRRPKAPLLELWPGVLAKALARIGASVAPPALRAATASCEVGLSAGDRLPLRDLAIHSQNVRYPGSKRDSNNGWREARLHTCALQDRTRLCARLPPRRISRWEWAHGKAGFCSSAPAR